MTSPAGSYLTDVHRRGQARIAAATAARMIAVWPLLDPHDLAGTTQRWIVAAAAVVAAQHAASSTLAAGYVAAFRQIEVPHAPPFTPPASPVLNQEALTTSLIVTGPVAVQSRLDNGYDEGDALDLSVAGSAAAGSRHAVNGGRDMVLATVSADPAARGWERITSGNACAFCDEIAGDGPFNFDADFPAHDGCNCTAEPAY